MCFPGWFCRKKKKKAEQKGKHFDEHSSSSANITANKPNSIYPSSSMHCIRSSPSEMKTNEITSIFRIPDKQTINQVCQANGFELGDELGKGAYATVYRAKRIRDNLVMACKVMRTTSSKQVQSAKNELFTLQRVNHPHIIKMYAHFMADMEDGRYVFIFIQLAEGDSLSSFMRSKEVKENPLSEERCKRMSAQIISAVHHVHSKGIAHRDIKMGNVLLDRQKQNCMVADFGMSRVRYRPSRGGAIKSTKFCGTRPYMAPEILLVHHYRDVSYCPFASDVWAVGVLLYCIVNRRYPFSDSDDILQQQMAHKIRFSSKIGFKPGRDIYDIFYRMLDPNVEKRIRMDQLVVHPWVANEVKVIEDNILSSSTSILPTTTEDSTYDPNDPKSSK